MNIQDKDKCDVINDIEKKCCDGKLTPSEKRFLEDFFLGNPILLKLEDQEEFRLDVLKYSIFESAYEEYIPMTGICIDGGILIGEKSKDDNCLMDFSCNQLSRQLKITGSTIAVGLDLSYCTLKSLILESCNLRFIKLSGSTLKGNLYIRKCSFSGPASVFSVDAENMSVEGSVSFTGSTFLSGVFLRGARISANADFSLALCISPEVSAIIGVGTADKVTCGNVEKLMKLSRTTFREFGLATKELDAIASRLQEKISSGNQCGRPERISAQESPNSTHHFAVCLQKAFVGGSIIFASGPYDSNGFLGVGEVTLNNCRTDGSILCSGSWFFHPGPKPPPTEPEGERAVALCLDAVDARLSIFLDEGFFSHGTVSLRGARTQQRLVCKKAMFVRAVTGSPASDERDNYALFAKRVSVQGDVEIHGQNTSDSAIWGRISFENGTIGGSLRLCAQEARTQSAEQQSTTLPRNINLQLLRIRANLKLILGSPNDESDEDSCTKGKGQRHTSQSIDLSFADIGVLSITVRDAQKTDWKLDGMEYRSIDFGKCAGAQRMNFDRWLSMLERQDAIQPYKPFIAYLKAAGLEFHVSRACFCKEDHVVRLLWRAVFENDRNERKDRWDRFSSFVELVFRGGIIRPVVGYGYKWGQGVVWLVLVILVGAVVFSCAEKDRQMFASHAYVYAGKFSGTGGGLLTDRPDGYPEFSPFFFSLDTAIPGLDIGQERHWDVKGDMWFEVYLYLHIVAGWLISFLLVLSPTQLLHRE